VIYGSYAKRFRTDDYPWAMTWQERLEYAERVERDWGKESDLHRMISTTDEAMAHWWQKRARASASPRASADLIRMNSAVDIREILPSVQAPTLVLHREGDTDSHWEEGRYLAEHIPNARFIKLEGGVHVPWIDSDQILDEVEEFVTGVRPTRIEERVLSTVLFTDLVGSTEKARQLGDRAWAELLERHHAIVQDELGRQSGEQIDTAGDGVFALFDGPARAIRCALAVPDAVGRLGLEVRAGVRTGEVERPRGGAPRGIAVHVGARVVAAAGAGEVLVTATTRDLVAGSGIEFEDRGEFELKGLGEKRRLYAATA
jgi:class 3 adenylate cyclase